MRTSAMAVITVAGLGLALTGCGDGTDDNEAGTPSASPTLTTTAPGGSGQVAPCVAGNWRTTSANGQANGGLASASITGGGGVLVQIGQDGQVTIDFSSMQPLTFQAKVADAQVAGTFTYAGKVTGQVRTSAGSAATPGATATPGGAGAPTTMTPAAAATATPGSTGAPTGAPGGDSAAMSGTWEPVPPVNWGDTRLTVDLTEPVKARPFENVKIGDYVGDGAKQSGDVVDIEPLLGEGMYQCQGGTLVLTPKNTDGIAWTLSRA